MDPIISVLLTTYHRPKLLKLAINSVLRQDFNNFELLVLDDASPDDTSEVVSSFEDQRIKYLRQKKNVGFTKNFRNGLKKAKGKYIFLLSDDDMILFPNTFSDIAREMDKTQSGIGVTSLLFYESVPLKPAYYFSLESDQHLPPSPENIIKTFDWHFGFMSGLCYRREFIDFKDIDDDLWVAHLKPLLKILVSHGCCYLTGQIILAKISTSGNIANLDTLKNEGYHLIKQINMYQQLDQSKERFYKYLKLQIYGVAKSFPGIKYFTSNTNTVRIALEIAKLYPTILLYFPYYTNLIIALLLPKYALSLIRQTKLKNAQRKLKPFVKQIKLSANLKEIYSF